MDEIERFIEKVSKEIDFCNASLDKHYPNAEYLKGRKAGLIYSAELMDVRDSVELRVRGLEQERI